jgi:hypothetical protein
MKKIIFTSSLLLLLIPTALYATSGACSGHGGVSCSAGADSDGSVICNDGWENSSVSYSSMKMCEGYAAPKPVPVSIPVKTSPPKTLVSPVTTPKKPIELSQPVATPEPKETTVVPAVIITPDSLPTVSPVTPVAAPVQKQSFWKRLFGAIFK